MKTSYLAIISILFLLCTSCATKSLWEATDPDKYIQIKFTDITEQELKDKGAKYYKDDKTHSYYVNKNSQDKLKNYAIRVFATPVTVVIDATTVVIFGIAMGFTDSAIDDYITNHRIDDYKVDPESDPHGPAKRN